MDFIDKNLFSNKMVKVVIAVLIEKRQKVQIYNNNLKNFS